VRVATFNVLFAHRSDGPGAWSDRRPLVRRAIARARPDLLGLQEVFPSTLDDIAEVIGDLTLLPGPTTGAPRMFDLSVPGEWVLRALRTRRPPSLRELAQARSERMIAGEHLPIAYRPSAFRPLASGGFWISPTPDRPGSMLSLAATPFLVHWARFERLDGGPPIVLMNGHFGHAPWHHAPTARVVADRIAALAPPSGDVILIGDFNAWPSSPLLGALTSREGAALVDAVRTAPEHTGPATTFHWGRGGERFGVRLDHVLARGALRPIRAEVIDEHEGALYPSDHYPLVVEFATAASTS